MGTIVVGVDHSEGAKAALRFALAEAQLRRARVRAVHVWRFGYVDARGLEGFSAGSRVELGELQRAAEAALDATLAEAVPEGGAEDVERRVVEGSPAQVLVEESRDAELLVVGSRGHGGFAGLLLGSVGQQCAQHAACPVVIIPHERT
jgi:nucleotide-binding universal stress UspA family protein